MYGALATFLLWTCVRIAQINQLVSAVGVGGFQMPSGRGNRCILSFPGTPIKDSALDLQQLISFLNVRICFLHVFHVLMTFLHGFVKIRECMLRLAHFWFKRSNVLQTLTNLSFRCLDSAWWLQVGSLPRLGSNKRTCSRKNSSRDAVLMETVQGAALIVFQRRLMLMLSFHRVFRESLVSVYSCSVQLGQRPDR